MRRLVVVLLLALGFSVLASGCKGELGSIDPTSTDPALEQAMQPTEPPTGAPTALPTRVPPTRTPLPSATPTATATATATVTFTPSATNYAAAHAYRDLYRITHFDHDTERNPIPDLYAVSDLYLAPDVYPGSIRYTDALTDFHTHVGSHRNGDIRGDGGSVGWRNADGSTHGYPAPLVHTERDGNVNGAFSDIHTDSHHQFDAQPDGN